MTGKNYFRTIGILEGVSLLALFFIAMPLKRVYGYPQAVTWVGSIHGILFLAYVYSAFTYASDNKWPWSRVILAIIVASLPFGTFWFDRKYLQEEPKASH